MSDETSTRHSHHPHHPRHELALRLIELAEDDERLLRALAVNEARQPGYLGTVLNRAHLITSALWEGGAPFVTRAGIEQAVDLALEWASPKRVLATPNSEPEPVSEEAMLELMRAQARFHGTTGRFDRRMFTRLTDEVMSQYSVVDALTPEVWSH